MRIVFDTNIVASATCWGGLPLDLIQLAIEQKGHTWIVTAQLLEEYEDVLARPHLQARLARRQEALRLIYSIPKELVLDFLIQFPPDPDDGIVLGAAVSGAADVLVTGDRALLELARFGTCRIVTVADALTLLD